MPPILFDKDRVQDIDISLQQEFLLANATGAYSSSTIVNCNTRKYHGVLVVRQPQIDDNDYVLLSSLDEAIVRGDAVWSLSTRRFPAKFHPEGFRALESFALGRVPRWTMRAGDVVVTREEVMDLDAERVIVRYHIDAATSPFTLRIAPLLAFRATHRLTHANTVANLKSVAIPNGIRTRLYSGFSALHLQSSRKARYTAAPDWHYNIEYPVERERGYDACEDLFCPGTFDVTLKSGDTFYLAAGTEALRPLAIKGLFDRAARAATELHTTDECLENAAAQFIVTTKKSAEIRAGFHWFGRWGRDTFIALPGLTLATGNPHLCHKVLATMSAELKDGLFPNVGSNERAAYTSADASLWYIRAVQHYADHEDAHAQVWREFGPRVKSILEHYRHGTLHHIGMDEHGLLHAGEPGIAVTWMDAVVDGKPVTPRTGLAVELNALWYNAMRGALHIAHRAGDTAFIAEWRDVPPRTQEAFTQTFWNQEIGYLADCVNHDVTDWSLRPNQVIAIALPFSPVTDGYIRRSVLDAVARELLTPRGLRTLAPSDPRYVGTYGGDQRTRDLAYHQGTVWPWLLAPYAEAYLREYGHDGVPAIRTLYHNFAGALSEYGLGTVAEIYDGDPPHRPNGAISQAWSVGALLEIRMMLAHTREHRSSLVEQDGERTEEIASEIEAAS